MPCRKRHPFSLCVRVMVAGLQVDVAQQRMIAGIAHQDFLLFASECSGVYTKKDYSVCTETITDDTKQNEQNSKTIEPR